MPMSKTMKQWLGGIVGAYVGAQLIVLLLLPPATGLSNAVFSKTIAADPLSAVIIGIGIVLTLGLIGAVTGAIAGVFIVRRWL